MTPEQFDRVEELKQLDRVTLAVRLMKAEEALSSASETQAPIHGYSFPPPLGGSTDKRMTAYSLDNLVAVLLLDHKIDQAQARFLTGIARFLETSPTSAIPAGWRLVPTEATADMVQAAEDRHVEGANYIAENSIQFALWREVWRAMLRAVPDSTAVKK